MNLKNSRFEWICKKDESTAQKFLRIFSKWGCIIFGILAVSLMLYIPFLIVTLILAISWFVLFRRNRIEYEFDYCSGDLAIFRISNAARRKRKFVCSLDDISYIQKGTNGHTATKKFYFDPQAVYTMQVNNSNGQQILFIEADEKFLQILEQERKLR